MGWLVYLPLTDTMVVQNEISTCTLVSYDFSVIFILLHSTFFYASEHDDSRKEMVYFGSCVPCFFSNRVMGEVRLYRYMECLPFMLVDLVACKAYSSVR